ncbi:MAG: DUF4350 domain-containing protein [Prevotella sp.]|nr:DUF4350 domain-containing protein [Prevotella sp.]
MNRRFIVAILALLLFFFFIQMRMPRHYVWKPTFAHSDEQPFGCRLFDSVMTASMPGGYTVSRQTLLQLKRDSLFMASPHGLVILTEERLSATDVRLAIQLAEQGHVLLLTSELSDSLADALHVMYSYNNYFNPNYLTRGAPIRYDTLCWVGPMGDGSPMADSLGLPIVDEMLWSTIEPKKGASYVPLLQQRAAAIDEATYEREDSSALAEFGEYYAMAFPMGKGEIIMLTAPLLFTNYGVLHEPSETIIRRLMSRMSPMAVVRTEAYMRSTAQTEQSPFYVFLQRPPLRWALYLAVLTVLLLMAFTARRRQRVIPIVRPPRNGNLEFVEHVGTLFFQQGDHRGLVERKLGYTAEEVRRLTGIDILEDHLPPDRWAQLSRLTGLTPDELRLRIANAREAITGHHVVVAEEMKAHIDNLNEIGSKLRE